LVVVGKVWLAIILIPDMVTLTIRGIIERQAILVPGISTYYSGLGSDARERLSLYYFGKRKYPLFNQAQKILKSKLQNVR
jgi:hypothetical protein